SKSIIDGICVSEQKDLDVNKSHDKNEFDNVDIIDLIDDEEGITELSLIQEKSLVHIVQQITDDTYINFLTPYETAEIKSFVNSHFEHIGISDGIKLFVEENKK
ncbi:23244_t:CDS:2, partial [Entrophospora sp. SA101]